MIEKHVEGWRHQGCNKCFQLQNIFSPSLRHEKIEKVRSEIQSCVDWDFCTSNRKFKEMICKDRDIFLPFPERRKNDRLALDDK